VVSDDRRLFKQSPMIGDHRARGVSDATSEGVPDSGVSIGVVPFNNLFYGLIRLPRHEVDD
jgi:hypothetical protein